VLLGQVQQEQQVLLQFGLLQVLQQGRQQEQERQEQMRFVRLSHRMQTTRGSTELPSEQNDS